jgi:hypothetical protein
MTNTVEFERALILETDFAGWCGDNYELFHHPEGKFPSIGSPREIYLKQCLPETWFQWKYPNHNDHLTPQ